MDLLTLILLVIVSQFFSITFYNLLFAYHPYDHDGNVAISILIACLYVFMFFCLGFNHISWLFVAAAIFMIFIFIILFFATYGRDWFFRQRNKIFHFLKDREDRKNRKDRKR